MTGTISTKELAAVLGISVQRVNELGRKGKIAREPDGKWNLVKVHAQLKANLDSSQVTKSLGQKRGQPDPEGAPSSNTDGTYLEAQCRHEWLRVEKEEMELRRRRGELLELDEVEMVWSGIMSTIQTRILGASGKLGPRVAAVTDARECSAIIDRELREILTVLSEYKVDAAA
jgi:hypothetical protein